MSKPSGKRRRFARNASVSGSDRRASVSMPGPDRVAAGWRSTPPPRRSAWPSGRGYSAVPIAKRCDRLQRRPGAQREHRIFRPGEGRAGVKGDPAAQRPRYHATARDRAAWWCRKASGSARLPPPNRAQAGATPRHPPRSGRARAIACKAARKARAPSRAGSAKPPSRWVIVMRFSPRTMVKNSTFGRCGAGRAGALGAPRPRP